MNMMSSSKRLATTSRTADSSFRRAKLIAPSPPTRSMARREIADFVARSDDARLVLFRSPAGFGKTTAMRQYLDYRNAQGAATAWLTLDELDDDYRRFLLHLIAAVEQVLRPPQGAQDGHEFVPAAADVEQLAIDLIDEIAYCAHSFTLFIDEFEAIRNRAIDDLLRLILSRLPRQGQLAIASRRTPSLQLGRLRARGQLIEVDQRHLRFSRDETDVFLRTQRGLALSDDSVTKLHGDTEGWPAALWLASTALANRQHPESFIATFSGSNAAVAEYLAEDVLSQQTADVQSFLRKTSLLSELSKPLCDALCERDDSEVLLERLEHSNVCITMLDSERRLYRYHGLFASFLRNQLHRLQPQDVPGLHLKAAKWYESEGRPIPAIEHALGAKETAYALSLLALNADSLLFQGRFRTLARWLDALPQGALRPWPRLQMAHIWALTFTGRGVEALRLLEALDDDGTSTLQGTPLAYEIDVLRPFILGTLDRVQEGYWMAEDALLKNSARDSFSYSVLTTTLATWRVANNRYSDAIALLKNAGREHDGEGKAFPTVYAVCIDGIVDLVQGRVRQAVAHFRVALSEAAATYGSRSIGKSIAAIFLAESLYEIDEIEEAEQLLALYLPIAREYAVPDQVIISHVIQARIAYDRGEVDHAFRRLSELEYFGRHGNLPRVLAAAQLERARLAMLREDLSDAQNHFERACNPEVWRDLRGMTLPANDVETVELCRFRLAIRGIGKGHLLQTLKEQIEVAQLAGRQRRVLKLSILYAKALHADGQHRLALRKMQDALRIACAEGMVRSFLDEGPPVIELLREFRIAKQASAERDRDNELIRFAERILRRAGQAIEEAPVQDSAIDASATLSTREQQILESVALGLSNIAIAKNLFVTETTVRAHLRKINVKLNAGNRTQAVSIARRLGLIHCA